MITLLLLRGWTGDAMATEMAASPLQHSHFATKKIVNHAYGISAEAHFHAQPAASQEVDGTQASHDCAGHHTMDTGLVADGHCDACAACQSCHSVALAPAGVKANPVYRSLRRPHAAAAQFASAEAALGQKPPIS
jgi:hypothetical protein